MWTVLRCGERKELEVNTADSGRAGSGEGATLGSWVHDRNVMWAPVWDATLGRESREKEGGNLVLCRPRGPDRWLRPHA